MPSGPRPQPPAGTVRVAMNGRIYTHRWAMVFYLLLADDGTRTVNDLHTILTALGTNWSTDVKSELSNDYNLDSIKGVWITSVGNQLTDIYTTTVTGTAGTGTVTDAGACYVIDWPISAYYRGGHPRSYVPGVLGSVVSNGSDISAGKQTSLATAMGNWRNHVNAITAGHVSSVQIGTVSFQTAKAWRATPVFRAYTGVGVHPKLGSQRRRILH